MDTTHKSNPLYREDRSAWQHELMRNVEGTRFVGFVVNTTEAVGDNLHYVIFEAAVEKVDQEDVPLVLLLWERSLYRRVGGAWRYARAESTRQEVVEGAGNALRAAICECLNTL